MFQVHLNQSKCSGRGVRCKVLTPDEADNVLLTAAKLVGADGTVIEMKKKEWSMGVKMMIAEVTIQKDLKSLQDPSVKWRKVTHQDLDLEYNKLFTPKDHAVLQALYRENHDVNEAEVQAITSKTQPVASED